jgi:dTDP-4-amino-4,6-dideoxygalactose transaminase
MTKDAWKRFGDDGYKHYEVVYAGFKYNMMDLQAAIGIHQMARIEKYWTRRRAIWQRYERELADLPLHLPAKPEAETRHAYHLYTLLIDTERTKVTRDQFMNELTRRNIGVGVHYVALHLHPYYRERFGYRAGEFPNAEWISERTVSIPLGPSMTDDDVTDVIEAIRDVLRS